MRLVHRRWSGYWQRWESCNCTMNADHVGMTLTSQTPPIEPEAYKTERHIIRGEN